MWTILDFEIFLKSFYWFVFQLKELGLESGSEDESEDEDGDDDEAVSDDQEKEQPTNVEPLSDGENSTETNREIEIEKSMETKEETEAETEPFSLDEVELLRKQVEESVVFCEKAEKGKTCLKLSSTVFLRWSFDLFFSLLDFS